MVENKSVAQSRVCGERPTIGLLIDNLGDTYHVDIFLGAVDAAREQGVNLVFVSGGSITSAESYLYEPRRTVLYDLVANSGWDGLIIHGAVGYGASSQQFQDFCARYRPLPMVSMIKALDGIPSVVIDNEKGLRDELVHLIDVHGYRRIAFLHVSGGHLEAEQRYRVYTEVLAEYGIPFEPALVVVAQGFGSAHVVDAVQELLERSVNFEAIVAVGDWLAFAAYDFLRQQGRHIPGDVALVGYDNLSEEALVRGLTTVGQPVYEMGRKAVEMLLALLEGKNVPQVVLPSELVLRQSCGCISPTVAQAAVSSLSTERLPSAGRRGDAKGIVAKIVNAVGGAAGGIAPERIEQLLGNFVAETKGKSPSLFLRMLDDILSQWAQTDASMDAWHSVVSILREYAWAHFEDMALLQAEDLCHRSRIAIAQAAERARAYHYAQKEQYTALLRNVEALLVTTSTVDGLMNVLAQRLPSLAVESAYLALYETPQQPNEWARLLLAYNDQEHFELPAGGLRFRSGELIPAQFLPQGRPYALVLESLFFGSNLLGFMLFEFGTRDVTVSQVLRIDISSTLQGAVLLRAREEAEHALERAYAEMEQQVVERTAQLRQETAERERLQREVIEAQQRAIQELSTPIIPVLEGVIVMPLIGSIDTLRARDVTRSLLRGIQEHRAGVVILDITGVPIVDSGVAAYLNRTVQAARLKGARTIVTGVSEAVAETIVDLGIDWSGIETLSDLRTGLRAAMQARATIAAHIRNVHAGGDEATRRVKS